MKAASATLRVWAGIRGHGRCRYCRKAIVWLTTDRGQQLPFFTGFVVRETQTHEPTGAQYHVVARVDLHDCEERRTARAAQRGRPRLF